MVTNPAEEGQYNISTCNERFYSEILNPLYSEPNVQAEVLGSFLRAPGLANDLSEAQANHRLSRFEQATEKADLLILDELSDLAFTKPQAELLFHQLSMRNERGSVIIATNQLSQYAFHANNPKQLARDKIKDAILKKYNIPILRIGTNESGEDKRLYNALLQSLNNPT